MTELHRQVNANILHSEKLSAMGFWGTINFDRVAISIEKLMDRLHGRSTNSSADLGPSIRSFHNKLGYQAFDGISGLCIGSLYRTESFMGVNPKCRSGKRHEVDGKVTVHIEHTVPVAILKRELVAWFHRNQHPPSISRVLCWLLKYSITTAMLKSQGSSAGLICRGYGKKSDCFSLGHEDFNYPFRRYSPGGDRIFNIVDGSEVDLNKFTFDDHVENLVNLSKLIHNHTLAKIVTELDGGKEKHLPFQSL